MNRSIFTFFLISLSALSLSSALAQTNQAASEGTVLNKVKIINKTSKDLGYIIISASANPDNLYGLKAKSADIYHAKATGDANATIKITECNKINKATGICSEYKSNTATNCLNEARYDFYKVKSVKISSLKSCAVTCNDGGNTSCVVGS
jgi:hypothetical protein